ncbi:MAG: DUF2226 domain-containing protein, partial [Methanosarcinales archaeon]
MLLKNMKPSKEYLPSDYEYGIDVDHIVHELEENGSTACIRVGFLDSGTEGYLLIVDGEIQAASYETNESTIYGRDAIALVRGMSNSDNNNTFLEIYYLKEDQLDMIKDLYKHTLVQEELKIKSYGIDPENIIKNNLQDFLNINGVIACAVFAEGISIDSVSTGNFDPTQSIILSEDLLNSCRKIAYERGNKEI